MTEESNKKPYSPIKISKLGSISELTQAGMMNLYSDAAGMSMGMGMMGGSFSDDD